jgi:hypothetical protein
VLDFGHDGVQGGLQVVRDVAHDAVEWREGGRVKQAWGENGMIGVSRKGSEK